jgi:hypothetical protein
MLREMLVGRVQRRAFADVERDRFTLEVDQQWQSTKFNVIPVTFRRVPE